MKVTVTKNPFEEEKEFKMPIDPLIPQITNLDTGAVLQGGNWRSWNIPSQSDNRGILICQNCI